MATTLINLYVENVIENILKEVNKTLKEKNGVSVIPDAIFLALMMIPNAKGYIWKDYVEATVKYNADQIYRQATIDLQQQKELDVTNDMYQNLIIMMI